MLLFFRADRQERSYFLQMETAWSFPATHIFWIRGRYIHLQAKNILLVWNNSLKTLSFPLWELFWENFWHEVFEIADFCVSLGSFLCHCAKI